MTDMNYSFIEEIITSTDYQPIAEVNGWYLDYHETSHGEYLVASYALDYPTGDEEDLHIFTDLDESLEFIKKQTGINSDELRTHLTKFIIKCMCTNKEQ